MTKPWRVAKSLDILLREINALSPNRDRSSDGSIGNEEHQSRDSDHNAWIWDPVDKIWIVSARDFTNDPKHGITSDQIAKNLINSHDDRIKYIISNRRIASGTAQDHPPWKWRPYNGKNPHTHHVHVSVKRDKRYYDNDAPWRLDITVPPVVANARPNIEAHPLLRVGNNGAHVKRLQYLLNAKGYKLREDGDFGYGTKKAVIAFQKVSNLVADGVVGPYTWAALEK